MYIYRKIKERRAPGAPLHSPLMCGDITAYVFASVCERENKPYPLRQKTQSLTPSTENPSTDIYIYIYTHILIYVLFNDALNTFFIIGYIGVWNIMLENQC